MNDSQDPVGIPPQEPQTPLPSGYPVAPRSKRFAAAMIDAVLGLLASIPLFNYFGVWDALNNNTELPQHVSAIMTVFGLTMFFVLHGYLLFHYGQTIGKRVLGLAIVTLDGAKPNFLPLILNRYLPQWVAGFIPVVGPLIAIADVMFIFFNDQNRCVHDLIAGTKVIDLSVKPQGVAYLEV